MSLAFPLGLLGLIGIPVLIIIYIIKNKYTEQVISSTYIWTLSEKFLKRRNPINKLVGIISLILQILTVLFVSVAVAQPVFTVPDSAYEYVFILDGSGSMNITEGSRTRFAVAKDEISSLINGSLVGSSYTLVCAGDTTEVVFEQITDKKYAIKKINELDEKYLDTGYAGAIDYAQQYFDNVSRSVKTYLITDKTVAAHENVNLINVAENTRAINYALSELGDPVNSNGNITVKGKAVSYQGNADLTVALYIDGSSSAAATVGVKVEQVEEGELATGAFELSAECDNYEYIRVAITQKDSLALDNEIIVYSPEAENSYEVLLVSDEPYMLKTALSIRKNVSVTTKKISEYNLSLRGYNLYIFDGYSPELPDDGAVWLINPKESVSGSGFSIQNVETFAEGVRLNYEDPTTSALELLEKNLLGNEILVTEYVKCGLGRRFSRLLTHDGNPVVFAGTTAQGVREIVVAFDIHKSSLPASPDFATLIGNFLNYTFPNVFEKTTYTAGETVSLNVTANCRSIRVETPKGNVRYLSTGGDVTDILLSEVGVYTVTLTEGGAERTFFVHAALPHSERIPVTECEDFSVNGEPASDMKDGLYDDLLIWFILIAVLFAADWMVYCYEQYQLR